MLTRERYSVVTASDGDQALAMVASEQPDLVVMDVLMPGLSGYDVCERIKHNPATRLTPVVLITALHEREHKIRGIHFYTLNRSHATRRIFESLGLKHSHLKEAHLA